MKTFVRILLLLCVTFLFSCSTTSYEIKPTLSDTSNETKLSSINSSAIVSEKEYIVKFCLNSDSNNKEEFGSFRIDILGNKVADNEPLSLLISAEHYYDFSKNFKNHRVPKIYKNSEDAKGHILEYKYRELVNNKIVKLGVEGSKAVLATAAVVADIALMVSAVDSSMSDLRANNWDPPKNQYLSFDAYDENFKDSTLAWHLSKSFDSIDIVSDLYDASDTKVGKNEDSTNGLSIYTYGEDFYINISDLSQEGLLIFTVDLGSETHYFQYKITKL
tara:strand:+ start:183 stop:1007 length:825 start_codon:yes stop_codon:yes gene_type:complete